ncbi:MAG: heme-binding domain-containing protein [Chloroflexi bacterium]|nr:heme-binding domain-containing protein [Chloroflexota bacterium]
MKKKLSWLVILVLVGVVGFGVLQLVPYGRTHSNPPVLAEPKWDSPSTRDLAVRGCFDCHSNEIVWPWYSNVAPISWLIQHDAEEGRGRLNFSEWPTNAAMAQALMKASASAVERGKMPPLKFLLIHKEAKFTTAEKTQLMQGLLNSSGQ